MISSSPDSNISTSSPECNNDKHDSVSDDSSFSSKSTPPTHQNGSTVCRRNGSSEDGYFECVGENDDIESYDSGNVDDIDGSAGTPTNSRVTFEDNLKSPDGSSSNNGQCAFTRSNTSNQWLRTSFRMSPGTRRTPPTPPNRRCGSFRLPPGKRPQSSSFSALPSSTSIIEVNNNNNNFLYEGADDESRMVGKTTLFEKGRLDSTNHDIYDDDALYEKVQTLQDQIRKLADSQAASDDRFARVKQENATLSRQIHSLEENMRDMEIRSEEKLISEQRRHRDIITRVEREKQLEVENVLIKLLNAEKENKRLTKENTALNTKIDCLREEKRSVEEELSDAQTSITNLNEENAILLSKNAKLSVDFDQEKENNFQSMQNLKNEIEQLKNESCTSTNHSSINAVAAGSSNAISRRHISSINNNNNLSALQTRLEDSDEQIRILQNTNRQLKKANEDLECEVLSSRVEQGQTLLKLKVNNADDIIGSLDTIDGDETDNACLSLNDELTQKKVDCTTSSTLELSEIRTTLREQKEVNDQLRNYIDSILVNIIDKYPDLLEVQR